MCIRDRDYMLDMRISGEEHIEGGMEIDEVAEFIKRIEDKIDICLLYTS